MTDKFPQWGFWLTGLTYSDMYNASSKRHLFLTENETACGWNPKNTFIKYSFSATHKIDGIYEVLSELKRGKLISAEDFSKCKRCLKIEAKTQ